MRKHHDKNKKRKRIVDAYRRSRRKVYEVITVFPSVQKWSESLIKIFKESHTEQNKSGRGRKSKISKTLEKKNW